MSSIVLVAKILAVPLIKKQKFYQDLKSSIGKPLRVEMGRPAFLAIEEKPAGIQFARYTADGKNVGDTWHASIEAAKKQAEYEFEDYYSDWRQVPVDLSKPVSSILDHLGIFETFYRVSLAAESLPPSIGLKVEQDVIRGFIKRPWNKNVICFWEPGMDVLFLRADHPYDDKGVIVGTEFVEEIIASLKVKYIDERTIKIIAVDEFKLYPDDPPPDII